MPSDRGNEPASLLPGCARKIVGCDRRRRDRAGPGDRHTPGALPLRDRRRTASGRRSEHAVSLMTAPTSQSAVTGNAPHESGVGPRFGRPSPVAVVALVLAAVPILWHAWVALHGFFTQDDFVFTYHAAHSPLSLHYLFQSYGGGAHSGGPHIMPAQFLLIWLVTRLAPGNYAVAVAPLLVMQALTCWVLWRLLSQLFPGNGARLIAFGFFTLSPVMFITSMWWAFGLQVVPFTLALFFALDQHVRYLHTGRRRHAVLALGVTVAGLVFWEKAALIVPVL